MTTPDPQTDPIAGGGSTRLAFAVLKAALALGVIGLVAWALIGQFRRVPWDQIHPAPLPAALSVLCMAGVSGMQLVMFRRLLAAYGHTLPWPATLAAAWIPPLGKYVPGKVASVVGAVVIQRRSGVSGAVAVSVALMLDGLAVVTGLIVSSPLLYWHPAVRDRLPTAWAWAVGLAITGLVALHPRVFSALVNALLRLLRRQPLTAVPPARRMLLPVLAAFGQWLLAGLGLWLMTWSVVDVPVKEIPRFTATAALAMTFSYLALFAPGGLGVREGLYLLALGPVIGPAAAIVVVAMRVVQTIIELALAGIGAVMLRRVTPAVQPG
jgi:hypothetical protein